MLDIRPTGEWKTTHPGAIIGLLEISNVDNTVDCPELNQKKREIEAFLRERFAGCARADYMAAPVFADYERYYKSFDKSYHVQLQVESIVLKGKSLPNVSPLVDANFAAEVETLVLTAGHDAAKLASPVVIDVSRPGDTITQMNGATKPVRAGDMVMRDSGGMSCSIIYGQDNRSPISAQTTHALYVSYAPPGVARSAVEAQLRGIFENVRTFAPACNVLQETILVAD